MKIPLQRLKDGDIKAFDLPEQRKKLVLDTEGVVQLGELLATTYLKNQ